MQKTLETYFTLGFDLIFALFSKRFSALFNLLQDFSFQILSSFRKLVSTLSLLFRKKVSFGSKKKTQFSL